MRLLAKILRKAFSYWIRTHRFQPPRRLRFWCVFGPFPRAVPLRFTVLKGSLWRIVFGAAQVCFLVLWLGSVAWPKLCQSLYPRFLLPVRAGPFSAPSRLGFWSVLGPFRTSVPLCFAVSRGSLRGFVLGLLKPVLWPCVQGPWPCQSIAC